MMITFEDEIAAKIDSLKDGAFLATFPQDLPDELFPSLINYAQYPGFEPKVGLDFGRWESYYVGKL